MNKISFSTSETNILKIIMLKLSKCGVSIFRNNVGTGWIGKVHKVTKPIMVHLNGVPVHMNPGDIFIKDPRPLNAGLFNGSSDLIGWKTIEITPEMVGKKIAVFTSIEGKKHNGRISPTQAVWIQNVKNAGGIAAVARTEQESEDVINKFLTDIKS
jgi:hypothetical protein